MIEANGNIIMSDISDIIAELKTQLELNGIHRFHKIIDTPNNLMVCCPFHNNGQERKPSMGIYKKDGICHCFRGDTRVITKYGTYEIKDLCEKEVEILNGDGNWEKVIFHNYGTQQLWKIDLTSNQLKKTLYATGGHEWLIRGKNNKYKTQELKHGWQLQKIIPQIDLSTIKLDPMGVVHGFCYGDGSITSKQKNGNNIYYACVFYNDYDLELKPYFLQCGFTKFHSGRNASNGKQYNVVYFTSDKKLKEIPNIYEDDSYLLGFLAGYFAADGNCSCNNLSIASYKKDDIYKVKDIFTKLKIPTSQIGITKIEPSQQGCVTVKSTKYMYVLRPYRNSIPDTFFITSKGRHSGRCKYSKIGYTIEHVQQTNLYEDVYCCQTSTHSFALEDFILTGNCFACGWVGPLSEMISNCFGYDDFGNYGNKWLIKNFLSVEISKRKDVDLDLSRNTKKRDYKYIRDEYLDQFRYYHPYMWKRKMTPETVEIFDIGYDRLTNCITFPVRDITGGCLFVAKRSVTSKFFHYPAGVYKPVYGIYELSRLEKYPDEIIICESMINCITCWAYGKYAVALNGTGTKEQYEELNKLPCRSYVLGLDPDDAGEHGREKLKVALKNKIIYEYIIPKGKDINDLTKKEFDNLPKILN